MGPCVLHRLRICWFMTTEGKTGVRGEKLVGAGETTNNNLNPNMASTRDSNPGAMP